MKTLKIHLAEITIAALFILWGYFLYAHSTGKTAEPEGVPYNNGWTCTIDGNTASFRTAYAFWGTQAK